jgi:predicted DNA-binding protein
MSVKTIHFEVPPDLQERWHRVTKKMRRGERSRLLRELLEAVVQQMEVGRKVRLAEIRVRRGVV